MWNRLLRPLAVASLVANIVIVVTGGAVRLTGSGLGCPTWPRCTDDSYVTSPEMGIHGVIEFSNRVLGMLVGIIAVAALLAALRATLGAERRRPLLRVGTLVLVGVLAQGLIGGVTVRTGLNPWTVATHFLISMVLIAAAYRYWTLTGPARPAAARLPRPLIALVRVLAAVSALVLLIGTLVTGSGPHAGDPDTHRMPFSPDALAQAHADAVFLLIGLSAALWFALRAVDAPPRAVRAVVLLLAVELAQGLVGIVQHLTHLPVALVAAHLLGACLVWLATVHLVDATIAGPLSGPPLHTSETREPARV